VKNWWLMIKNLRLKKVRLPANIDPKTGLSAWKTVASHDRKFPIGTIFLMKNGSAKWVILPK